jgi:hypothetical protein
MAKHRPPKSPAFQRSSKQFKGKRIWDDGASCVRWLNKVAPQAENRQDKSEPEHWFPSI